MTEDFDRNFDSNKMFEPKFVQNRTEFSNTLFELEQNFEQLSELEQNTLFDVRKNKYWSTLSIN